MCISFITPSILVQILTSSHLLMHILAVFFRPFCSRRKTVWRQDLLRTSFPRLNVNMTADVVVIGGGIAGVSTAYNLSKAGKQVVLLEGKVRG